jgi:hypothetical protein
MKTTRSMKLYLTIAGLMLVLLLGGCATAPKMEHHAVAPLGATWIFSQSDTGSYGSGTTQFTVKVVERTWEEKPMIAQMGPTGGPVITPEGRMSAWLSPDGKPIMTFEPPIGFEYPLEVGKTWNKSYRVTVGASKQTIPFDTTWKVEGYEDVTVPAGTFKVFKVSYSDTIGSENVTCVNPEVGTWIKRVETRTAKHPAGPGTREYQLISYTIPK